jgi:pyruvate/2-oxoglutarate dehydrogenase complex dihydrolipoamide acyltransferase (E2) component
MDVPMTMPDLSAISESVKIVRWLVEVGQSVRRGDALLEVETDKSTMVVESTVTGTLKSTHCGPGEAAESGRTIAVFDAERSAPRPAPGAAQPTPAAAPSPQGQSTPSTTVTPPAAGASFFARNRRAAEGPEPKGGSDGPAS